MLSFLYLCDKLSLFMSINRRSLLGLSLSELESIVLSLGMARYTAKQLSDWLYVKRVDSIDDMTNLSKTHRELLSERFQIGRTAPILSQLSEDGTKKYLFAIGESAAVESVYIPDGERATLCISSQVGCKMGCTFCMTGRQGFTSQLTAAQILNQIISIPESDTLTNVVLMGMGEPLDNLDAVLAALHVMTSDWGFGWSPKRVTLSTVGITPALRRFLDESDCHLAISLHSVWPEQRQRWMAIEKVYPFEQIRELLLQYNFSGQRRLSFEYILFRDQNDGKEAAKELVRLLDGLDARVNLIKYHTAEQADFKSSDLQTMVWFRDFLLSKGVNATIRRSRGEDIMAACGLLAQTRN